MLRDDYPTRVVNCLECLAAVQHKIARDIILEDEVAHIESIAAIGHAFSREHILTSVVVVDQNMRLIDEVTVIEKVQTPYIPGLLFCREGPAILKAVGSLRHAFDALLIDACGINHYRFAGLASHIGVLLDMPTIGVSHHTLCGEYATPREPGSYSELRSGSRVVGFVVKTQKDTKPIFVSPGHRVSLQGSLTIVLSVLRGHKMPEPLHIARAKAHALKRAVLIPN